jgi:hypothetical protein
MEPEFRSIEGFCRDDGLHVIVQSTYLRVPPWMKPQAIAGDFDAGKVGLGTFEIDAGSSDRGVTVVEIRRAHG